MNPYYIARAVGGTMFFVGTLLGIYNIWMTIRQAPGRGLASTIRPRPRAGERSVPAE